jgi:hemerythrin superfamily protein
MTDAKAQLTQLLVAHAHADHAFAAIGKAVKADDAVVIAREARALEKEMLQHLTAEETLLFPDYAAVAPYEVVELRTAHAKIRQMLAALLDSAVHDQVTKKQVDELVNVLLAHHAAEETGVYRWARARQA